MYTHTTVPNTSNKIFFSYRIKFLMRLLAATEHFYHMNSILEQLEFKFYYEPSTVNMKHKMGKRSGRVRSWRSPGCNTLD